MRSLLRQSRILALLPLAAVAIGCSSSPGPATPLGGGDGAGASGGDVEAVRAERAAAAAIFLDRDQPQAARLEAAGRLGDQDAQTHAAMLEVGRDPTEDDQVRWQALRLHPFDRDYIEAVLEILTDPEDGGAQLEADLIEDLGRRSFQLPTDLEQRIIETLRALLDDPRDAVRLAAYRVLVMSHDTVALSRLSDHLRSGEEVPIPLAEAIRLLDIDGSIYHLDVIRPYLEHPDPQVRAEAARALAVDPDSRPRIIEMVRDAAAAQQVRLLAIRALAREDARFPHYAIPLVADRQEGPAVRRAAMKAMVGRMNYFPVDPKEQIRFAEVVEALARARPGRGGEAASLHAEARELLVYLKKAFPAIESHYAGT